MAKYARFRDYSGAQDGSDQRTVDVVDMSDYGLASGSAASNEAFLQRIFSPQLVEYWKANGHWFIAVPGHVQSGARFIGSEYSDPFAHLNADGTDGNGLTSAQ